MAIVNDVTKKKKYRYQANGYAGTPGQGLAGENCKTCRYSFCNQFTRKYWKCVLMEAKWTGSRRTDINVTSPACEHWQREDGLPKTRDSLIDLYMKTFNLSWQPSKIDEKLGMLISYFCPELPKTLREMKDRLNQHNTRIP
jgi:hypothetical protein